MCISSQRPFRGRGMFEASFQARSANLVCLKSCAARRGTACGKFILETAHNRVQLQVAGELGGFRTGPVQTAVGPGRSRFGEASSPPDNVGCVAFWHRGRLIVMTNPDATQPQASRKTSATSPTRPRTKNNDLRQQLPQLPRNSRTQKSRKLGKLSIFKRQAMSRQPIRAGLHG